MCKQTGIRFTTYSRTMATEQLQFLREWMPAGIRRYNGPRLHFGRLEWIFLIVALIAAAMRLWELDERVMHYDEAIHLHFSWKLARGMEFVHSPWMHGPFQIELVALALKFIGDTDFLARLPYALFGVVLVVLPYFLRDAMGEKGAVCAAVILAFSPSLLYFSRFGRNDILMAVWAVSLLIMLWRYTASERRRYLFGAAAITALMLATKETAYFVILFMGLAALGLGWRQILGFLRGRQSLAACGSAAGFFILLATLTLPQAAALIAIAQSPFGLTLAAHDAGSTGDTGAPVWEAPFANLPIWDAPMWVHIVAAAVLVVLAVGVARAAWRVRSIVDLTAVAVATLSTVAAVAVVVASPFQRLLSEQGLLTGNITGDLVDYGAGLALLLLAVALPRANRSAVTGWRGIMLLLGPAALLTFCWLLVCWGGSAFIGQLLPAGASADDISAGKVAVNYLIPLLTLLGLLAVGGAAGIAWGGGVWLGCAAVFYGIWIPLYTTLFTNWAGMFTGAWQSLGYWLMQQDVARGNQPWYYYIVGLTVYELLALAFGIVAVVWLVRRREPFGIILAAWVVATLAIYTVAAEKMPWLLVNMTVPLALAAGMLIGHLLDRVPWPLAGAGGRRLAWSLALAPAWVGLAIWVAWLALKGDNGNIWVWLGALILLPLAALLAALVRVQPGAGAAAALGVAGLLLVFGVAGAWRAAYTYDDSNLEILAYAQGSADLTTTYVDLKNRVFSSADGSQSGVVKVDYDMWYPFQWYVREETGQGTLQFDRFCAANDDDGSEGCRRVGEDAGPRVYLAEHAHAVDQEDANQYRKDGPMRNLLWYPETYRRPGESRTDTGMWRQLNADVAFFRDTAADPEKLRSALEYVIARRQESDWFTAEYYQYTKE